jgi:hypothetical protein
MAARIVPLGIGGLFALLLDELLDAPVGLEWFWSSSIPAPARFGRPEGFP